MKKLLVAAILAVSASPAASAQSDAGASCAEQIARLRSEAGASANGPTSGQTVGAQLGRQPTPASVAQARQEAKSRFEALIAHAGALEAEGKHAQCMQDVFEAQRLLAPY